MIDPLVNFIFWFLFAIWAYLFLIYILGFVWFLNKKAKKVEYDKKLILIQFSLFGISTIVQFVFLFFYFNLKKSESIKIGEIKWIILIILNFIFIFLTLIIFFLFSNNFCVKFEKKYTSFLGITILNTSIISIKKDLKGCLFIEYVYKKEKNMKWTEKLKLIRKMKITNFFYNNYKEFIEPEKNLAFFDIDKIIVKNKSNEIIDLVELPKSIKLDKSNKKIKKIELDDSKKQKN